jgi:hypothetical protein
MAIMVLLVIGALGPANLTPRTALGWQIDHFLGYFAITFATFIGKGAFSHRHLFSRVA